MNTNFKFDVWDKADNALIKGNDVIIEARGCSLNEIFDQLQSHFIILRYSGLPDLAGNEIREGHVIVGADDLPRIVTYKSGSFLAIHDNDDAGIYLNSIFHTCYIIAGDESLPAYFFQ